MKLFKSAKRLKTNIKTRKLPAGARQWLHVEALEPRWVLDSGLSQNQAFVSQAYIDLLNRQVDPTGLAAWSGLLNQGGTRDQVAEGILGSAEFRTDFVEITYTSLLRRPADSGGLQAWLAGINGGATFEQTEAGIVGSVEYFQDAGGTNAGFLAALYHDALGRPVDPVGQAAWGPMLDGGVARSVIASAIYTSPEFRQDLVNSFYLKYLHRSVDSVGLFLWVSDLQTGARDEDVIAGIIGSQEYATRAAAPPSTPALNGSSDGGVMGDGITNINTPTFTGAAEPGTTVMLLANGIQVGSGTTSQDGIYSVPSSTLADGVYSITTTAVNQTGPVSSPSAAFQLTIDTQAPAAPTITSPSAPVLKEVSAFTITGTAEANSLVLIYRDVHGTGVLASDDPLVGSQPPGSGTSFAITVPIGFQTVNHFLATASDIAGNQSAAVVVPDITNPFPQPSSRDQTNKEGDVVNVPPFFSLGSPNFYSAIGLPPGLHIDLLSGVISGTLTGRSAGLYFPNVIDNGQGGAAEVTFLWTVIDGTSPVVTAPPNQGDRTGDTVIALTVTATDADNDPLTFSATGLPAGLSIDPTSGVIHGSITAPAGTHTVTVSATDGLNTGSATFTWTIANPFVISRPNDQTNNEGDAVSLPITTLGSVGTLTYTATGLPPGLQIGASTGDITGTLTGQSAGSYMVIVTATDGMNIGHEPFNWTVADITTPVVTPPANQADNEGDVVSVSAGVQATATDADGDPLTFSAQNLPPGLSIDPTTGIISGTIQSGASAGSPYNVAIVASDGVNTGAASLTWLVVNLPIVAPPPDQLNFEGDFVSGVLVSSFNPRGPNPLTLSASNLPAGLTLDSTTGEISGMLTSPSGNVNGGHYVVTISATNGVNTGTAMFNWTVIDVTTPIVTAPADQTTNIFDVVTNVQATATDADGDPLTFSASDLPPGLSIDPSTGMISGIPTAPGLFSVTISASDGVNAGSATFHWAIVGGPPPIVTPPANQANNEGDVINGIFVFATGPTNLPITFSADKLPPGLTIDSSTGEITGTINVGDKFSGSPYTVTVTASNGENIGVATFSWIVDDNTTPVVGNPGEQVNFEGDSIDLVVPASDPDGVDIPAISAQGLPPGLSIDATSGEITGTLTAQSAGQYTVTVSAFDGVNTGTTTIQWLVFDTTTPIVTAPADQTNNIDGVVTGVQVNATDADGDPLTFSASDLPVGLSIDPATGVISGTPTIPGLFSVTISASDGVNTGTATFNWAVTDAGPIVTRLPNQANNEGAVISGLFVTALNPSTFSADNLPPGLTINSSTGEITGTIDIGDKFGGSPYTVTVTASDGHLTGTLTFIWIVDDNTTPVVASPGDQMNFEGDSVDIFAEPSDPDGVDVPVVSAQGLPPGLSIDSTSGEITGTLRNQSAGMYTVVVSAFDGVNTGTTTFQWNVIDTTTPVVTAPADQANNEGATVAGVVVSAEDADNDPLTFSAVGLPPGLSIDPNTGEISGTVRAGATASSPYSVTVMASDGTNSGSASFMWRIDSGLLLVTQPADQSNNEGDTVSLSITASDPDGDTVTFSAQNLPPGLSIDANGNITGTLTGQSAGTYLVTVSASDGLNSASAVFNWTVADISTPQVTPPVDRQNQVGDTLSAANGNVVTLTTMDADGDFLTFAASNLPPGLTIDTSGNITGTFSGQSAGTYLVTVSASDGPNTGTATFTWTVTA